MSFLVDKVDDLRLCPMSFEEYLLAMGEERLSWVDNPMTSEINQLSERYGGYLRGCLYVGGMPEAVDVFRQQHDPMMAREVQEAIVGQYEGDFGKHVSPAKLPRIRMAWNAIPVWLTKENRKFSFGQVKQGARMKDFEAVIHWLVDAGLVYRINKVTKPGVPLRSYVDLSAFKLFMVDVGLLGAMSGLDYRSAVHGNDAFVVYEGTMTEQCALQQLVRSTGQVPCYYAGEKSTYETDFLIQREGEVVPIEVKVEENLKSKSLRAYVGKFRPRRAVHISIPGFREQDWMVNIPLWAIQGV